MTSVQNPFSETTAFTYDGAGRENKRTFHSGQYEERGYDDRDRLTSVTLKNSSHTTLRSQSYGYDNASNVTSHTVDGVQTTYGYDNADQLTSESRTGYSASYTYDANGNRATRTVNSSTETYTNDSGDKLTSISVGGSTTKSYGYDAAGRTTSVVVAGVGTTTLSYDYEGRITQITYPNTSTNTFQYNGLSARTQKVDSTGTRNYKRDGATVVSPVINDGAANYTPSLSERRSSTTAYLHAGLKNSDAQSGTAQTIGGSRTYDAYGNVAASTGTWSGPFGYGSSFSYHYDSDSGLTLLGRRYLDSSTGRFITRDPSKAGRNWYGYANCNPLKYADPNDIYMIGVGADFTVGFPGPSGGASIAIAIDDEGDIGIIGNIGGGFGWGDYAQAGPYIAWNSGDLETGVGNTNTTIGAGVSIGIGVGGSYSFSHQRPNERDVELSLSGPGGGGGAHIRVNWNPSVAMNVREGLELVGDAAGHIGDAGTELTPTPDRIREFYPRPRGRW